jgi:hypothetical protein
MNSILSLISFGCSCYFYNKIDTITIEEVDQLARMPHSLVGSVKKRYNIAEPLEDDPLKVCLCFLHFQLDISKFTSNEALNAYLL